METFDLTKILSDAPRECWLAFNEDQTVIVGRGETVSEAVEEARKHGVQDPIIMWSPKKWIASIYCGGA